MPISILLLRVDLWKYDLEEKYAISKTIYIYVYMSDILREENNAKKHTRTELYRVLINQGLT